MLEILGRQNQVLEDLTRTPTRSSATSPATTQRRPLGQGGRGRRDHLGRAPPRHRRGPRAAAGLPARARPTMAELGATADAQTPDLRDLNASAGSSRRFFDASARSPRRAGERPHAGRGRRHRRGPRSSRRKPTVAELTKTTEKAPELANNLEIVLATSTTASARSRRTSAHRTARATPASRRPAVRLRPDDGDQHLRRERPHPEGQPVGLGVQRVPERRLDQAQGEGEPGFISRCLAGLGPNQPGVTTPDPTDTGARTPATSRRRQEEGEEQKQEDQAGARTASRARTRPASPTSRRRSTGCSSSGGGGNKPDVPGAAERADAADVPRRVPAPTCRTSPAAAVSGQSVDQNALLDYLLSP